MRLYTYTHDDNIYIYAQAEECEFIDNDSHAARLDYFRLAWVGDFFSLCSLRVAYVRALHLFITLRVCVCVCGEVMGSG